MKIIEILKVIVTGIVEGFTEWLPISSAGHMMLLDELIHLDAAPEFKDVFMALIQMGAMLAVLVLFGKRLNPFHPRKNHEQRLSTWRLWSKILVGCLPAGLLGLLFDDWIDTHLRNGFVIAAMLILYGILFLVIEDRNRYKEPVITRLGMIDYQTALYIGLIQILALIPGASRSAVVILGAMILGCSRQVSAEFSFFLGIPVILGTGILKLIRYGAHFTGSEIIYLIIGILTAFLVSVYAIGFIMKWIRHNDFKIFGYYRIALGIIIFLWFAVNALVD